MSNNFNSRLGLMYIINAPKSISIPWALFKPFSFLIYYLRQFLLIFLKFLVDKDTREKIKITGDPMHSDIYKHVSKD